MRQLSAIWLLMGMIMAISIGCGKNDKTQGVSNYPAMDVPKMTCLNVDTSIHCQGNSALELNGIPDGCDLYSDHGDRLFLNGTLTTVVTYDCHMRYNALRCFYYTHNSTGPLDDAIEDVICQEPY